MGKGFFTSYARDEVVFFLHPIFTPASQTVMPVNGEAKLTLHAWGAFTVGALADGGRVRLELDLAGVDTALPAFRER